MDIHRHRQALAAAAVWMALSSFGPAHAGPPSAKGPGMGVTWGKQGHDAKFGIDRMSCWGGPPTAEGGCDAYHGDTSCSAKLPVLCVRIDDSPRPNYAIEPCVGCYYPAANYGGWIEGHVAAGPSIAGYKIQSLQHMHQLCEGALGKGWKAGEFNDGRWFAGMDKDKFYGAADWPSTSPWPLREGREGGWGWYAYGNVDESTRYWMYTLGQPDAHCFPLAAGE